MPALILSLLVLGMLLILFSRRRLKVLGIPAGRLISLDTSRLIPVTQPLYDPDLGLTGRPDYLVQRGRCRIPVEVKSGQAPQSPHRSHVLQLAAYCHLVEMTTGKRPAYGILKYADSAYKLQYTHALQQDLLQILGTLRKAQDSSPGRSHNSPARCRACGYLSSCDQSLA
ncbi:MAG: Dna2/Cas4 domain-containing protein [Anaerolineales bacterium]|jgi:CRISPR-associated exonuclease Cas4|nr:Dna2/Cas4 domain-containing protein [Anaerolineales bacterium]